VRGLFVLLNKEVYRTFLHSPFNVYELEKFV